MSVADFGFFCVVALFSAVFCIRAEKTLYAVIWQLQAATAICGMMACQNAHFAAFALMSTAASIFLTLLMFSLIVFSRVEEEKETPSKRILFFCAAVLLPIFEFGWLYLRRPLAEGLSYSGGFSLPALGSLLYTRYALCVIVSALVLTGAMVGITMLMMNKKGDGASVRDENRSVRESKTELRRIPVERKYL